MILNLILYTNIVNLITFLFNYVYHIIIYKTLDYNNYKCDNIYFVDSVKKSYIKNG